MIHGHPLMAYRAMLETAEAELCVFTGPDDLDYRADLIGGAVAFLAGAGRHLRMACQCGGDIRQCEIIQAIIADAGRVGRLTVYRADRYADLPYIMIADRTGYCYDAGSTAKINYGDQVGAERWQADFEQIVARSTVVIDDFGLGVQ